MSVCDAAVASVPDESMVSSWQGDDFSGYDTPVNTVPLTTGLRVKKFGRTTGITYGTVEILTSILELRYRYSNFAALVWFTGLGVVWADAGEEFALPGDSGSLVVTEGGDAAVGLLFAAGPQWDYAWIAPIDTVLNELSLTLVGNHGI